MPKTSGPRTWRIKRIPIEVTKAHLQTQLEEGWSKTTEKIQPNDEIILQLTLVPYSRRFSCATVTCHLPPALDGTGYIVDPNFFGITPLANAPNASTE